MLPHIVCHVDTFDTSNELEYANEVTEGTILLVTTNIISTSITLNLLGLPAQQWAYVLRTNHHIHPRPKLGFESPHKISET